MTSQGYSWLRPSRALRATLTPLCLVLTATLVHTSCGGGGGASTQPPTPVPPPTVTVDSQTADRGTQVTFTAKVTGGTAPYTYQWTCTPQGGQPAALPGATSSTYVIQKVDAADHLSAFTVRVTDKNGKASTNATAAILTVNIPLAPLVVAISNQTVNEGQTATFHAAVEGGASPYTYQWARRDGGPGANFVAIQGATSQDYTTPALTVAADDKAVYRVTVWDGKGATKESNESTLTVTIPTQPLAVDVAPQATLQGQEATFTATVTGGTAPYTYQWSKTPKGGSAAEIPGATASTCKVTPTLEEDGAVYAVKVTDSANQQVSSKGALLTVTAKYEDLKLSLTPEVKEKEGATATFKATVTGGKGVYTYQWSRTPLGASAEVINQATTDTLSIPNLKPSDEGTIYTVKVTDAGTPASPISASGVLHVQRWISAKLAPTGYTVVLLTNDGQTPPVPRAGGSIQADTRVPVPGGRLGDKVDLYLGTENNNTHTGIFPFKISYVNNGPGSLLIPNQVVAKGHNVLQMNASKINYIFDIDASYFDIPSGAETRLEKPERYTIDIFQANPDGTINWDRSDSNYNDPRSISISGTSKSGPNVASCNLYPGTYKALLTFYKDDAARNAGTPALAITTIISDNFTPNNPTITLNPPKNRGGNQHLSIKLTDSQGNIFPDGQFSIHLYDKTSLLSLGHQIIGNKGEGNGLTHFYCKDQAEVIAIVRDLRQKVDNQDNPTYNKVVGIKPFKFIGSLGNPREHTVSWPMRKIQGSVSGATISNENKLKLRFAADSVKLALKKLGDDDDHIGNTGFEITQNTADYSVSLFEGDWVISTPADTFKNLPDPAPLAVALKDADTTGANISVAKAGTISGTLQDSEGRTITADTKVELLTLEAGKDPNDPTAYTVRKTTQSGTTGKFVFHVPFNVPYQLLVDGAAHLTNNLVATPEKPDLTQTVVQRTISGHVMSDQTPSVGASVCAGYLQRSIVTTNAAGEFTINLFQGRNSLWVKAATITRDASTAPVKVIYDVQ